MFHKTKIICTIGPKVASVEKIKELIVGGMSVARLNFSHGSHEEHAKTIGMLKAVREEMSIPLAIMLDSKGPEVRLGALKDGLQAVKAGEYIYLSSKHIDGIDGLQVLLHPKQIISVLSPGIKVIMDDGYILAHIVEVQDDYIKLQCENSGIIRSNKSVTFQGIDVPIDFLTEQDILDIKFGCLHDVDYVAASFVRVAEDITSLRNLLLENGKSDIKIIAKIETRQGVMNFDSIADNADGIMVARGDLGIEVSIVEVPRLQKMMAIVSRNKRKACITATQMLESMIMNPMPTRAEVSDVANAIYDGTSAVMLSAETAMGSYPIESITMMRSVIKETEQNLSSKYFNSDSIETASLNISIPLVSLGQASIDIAYKAGAKAIIVFTLNGATPRFLSGFRPNIPVIAVTPSLKLYYSLSLEWGILPLFSEDMNKAIWRKSACSYAVDKGLLGLTDNVVILARSISKDDTNAVMIHMVSDILNSD